MSRQIPYRRLAAVRLADAINKIEGVPVTAQAKELSTQWARGKISGPEIKALLIKTHKRVVTDKGPE